MGQLLNRKCRVTLAVGSPVAGAWFQYVQDTIVIEHLRVKFSTERHLGKHPNEGTIEIYNCNEQTRNACQVLPLNVTLEVAYGDDAYTTLMRGDIRHAESRHVKTEWITKLQIGDGERAFANAQVNLSLRGNVTGQGALKAIVSTLGLHIPKNLEDAQSMLTNIVSNGLTMSGPSHQALSDVLDPSGMTWSIQDQQLQVLGAADVIDGNGVVSTNGTVPALLVSQATGMIEVPDYSVPKALGKPPILKVKMLIDTRAVPGRLMKMDSTTVKGNFRIEDVKTNGDTEGSEWHTEVSGKAL